MEEYQRAKGTKLKLKGVKNEVSVVKKKKRKVATSPEEIAAQKAVQAITDDTTKHGGWWSVSKFDEISGTVAIEFGDGTYVKCLDDGTFTLGAPHGDGDGPAPEEIFTAIRINDDKVALKSGYGKYLGVEKDGGVVGRSDAVGAVEQWEVIFDEGKLALLSNSGYFMTIDPVEESLCCKSRKAGPSEIVKLRCIAERKVERKEGEGPEGEEVGSIRDIEINYVKKFQKFQNKVTQSSVHSRLGTEDLESVKKAKEEGTLHESLLDRRSKMKADRYWVKSHLLSFYARQSVLSATRERDLPIYQRSKHFRDIFWVKFFAIFTKTVDIWPHLRLPVKVKWEHVMQPLGNFTP